MPMNSVLFACVLDIPPLIKKNSKNIWINKKTGKPFPGSNKRYEQYKKIAVDSLMWQWLEYRCKIIDFPVHAKFTFYYAGQEPDLSNMYEAIQDFLQTVGVIVDDRLIHSHDGSRKHHVCEGCNWYCLETGKRKLSTGKNVRCPTVKKCEQAQPRIAIELRRHLTT